MMLRERLLRRSVNWCLNWGGPEKTVRISHRPSEHLARSTPKLWRFGYSYLNMTRPAMQWHFTLSILKSVQRGDVLRCLHFIHSSSGLKDFRVQDECLIPPKLVTKLSPTSVEPESQTRHLCHHLCTAYRCLLTFSHIHTCTHTGTQLHWLYKAVLQIGTLPVREKNPWVFKAANYLTSSKNKILASWNHCFWFAFQPRLGAELVSF